MTSPLTTTIYIITSVLFILALGGLSKQETAKKGNILGMTGMGLALLGAFYGFGIEDWGVVIGAIVIAVIIGATLALRVEMTSMPELIAAMHSLVGMAAVLIGFASFNSHGNVNIVHGVELFLGIFIGAVTFSGSIVAFLKLRALISSQPLVLPAKNLLNGAMLVASLVFGYLYLQTEGTDGLNYLLIMAAIAIVFGLHLVASIGGADMPVVISMLNSYSGWAAAATGFMLANDLLIITGALVGSSGAILSYIMCRAMNRSFISVILGGFGIKASVSSGAVGEYVSIEAEEVADLLNDSSEVIIVPGYGMAVAQAQHHVQQITTKLKEKGINVRFAIHPVAGRLPGHMNVLLAEAKVSYDIVLEMDEINEDFAKTDTVLVIGANDTVNPDAKTNPDSPIAGMPIIETWHAKNVIALKRGKATGYAGVENPLFFKENTRMLFGDAKDSLDAVLKAL